jgi:Ca2+-binding RTX toxin-like protein
VIVRPLRRRRRLALLLTAAALAATATVVIARPATAAPADLIISEYVEGSSSNKALELYNGTGAPIPLDGTYDIQIFANGSPTATATVALIGTIAPGEAFVLARSAADPALLALADQTTTNFLWSGNDAVALRKAGVMIDAIGQIGVDPGTEWGSGDASTADNTLRRRSTVEAGDPDGSDLFDPAVQWTGHPIDTFDGLGSHTTTGGGGGANTSPNAVDDSATVEEDETAIVAVLGNDSDLDGDPVVLTGVDDPAHGSASIVGSDVVYVPDVDFAGVDAVVYTVGDGRGGTDSATLMLSVLQVNDDPDPEDDSVAVAEDGIVTLDVVTNDEDVDGDTIVVSSVDDPDHGTASIAPDGRSLVYSPDPNWNGSETFSYTVADGHEGAEAADVTATVTPVNDPPRAEPDTAAVAQGMSAVVDVVANDSAGPPDESGQTLAVLAVGSPGHGTATLLTTGADAGSIRYVPDAGFTGVDSFTYDVSDGDLTATGTVTVTVTAPVARTFCGLVATIVGTTRADVIVGTPGDDVIHARRGNDVIDGNGGSDVICGGPGADRITTLDGADRIAGGTGQDTIDGGAGKNRVRGGFGDDAITTGAGDDRVAAGPGADTVDAGDGANTVGGGAGDDVLRAGSGSDRLDGGPGADTCDPDGGRNSVIRCE